MQSVLKLRNGFEEHLILYQKSLEEHNLGLRRISNLLNKLQKLQSDNLDSNLVKDLYKMYNNDDEWSSDEKSYGSKYNFVVNEVIKRLDWELSETYKARLDTLKTFIYYENNSKRA